MKKRRAFDCGTGLAALFLSLSLAAAARPSRAEPATNPNVNVQTWDKAVETHLTSEQIARAQRAYEREPGVGELVAAALRVAAADPRRAREMASRARHEGREITGDLATWAALDALEIDAR